ncbi:MAG: helix-turn-helix domain-containing protein [Lachnospiraceae bacterium]|nr:helix-turn-helix domain-containing protein [Lachnospiraceae bacterium]
MSAKIKTLAATDERQYMIHEKFEVYEKHGAPIGASSFHYHNFYEIIYVLEGEYSSLLENQTYHLKKGDFLLIDSNVMHKYHYIENKHDSSRRIILWITKNTLDYLSDNQMDLTSCFRNHDYCAYHFPLYYEEMLQGYLMKLVLSELIEGQYTGSKEVMDRGYLTLFFAYLNLLCNTGEYSFKKEETISHPLVETVSSYIEEHIQSSISLSDLAQEVHMSKYHFLRKFKELTGVTVHSFITNKRLINAVAGLKAGKTITQVYQESGFSDYSSFLRNFKKTFGVSPGKYKDVY